MADLLDANVWVALSTPTHVHFLRAQQYWNEQAIPKIFFCRTTAMALLRLLSNPRVAGFDALEGAAAWRVLQTWQSLAEVSWAGEPQGLDEFLRPWAESLTLHGGDWTDSYLAAFSTAGGYRLVSFDAGFRRFAGLDWLHLGV